MFAPKEIFFENTRFQNIKYSSLNLHFSSLVLGKNKTKKTLLFFFCLFVCLFKIHSFLRYEQIIKNLLKFSLHVFFIHSLPFLEKFHNSAICIQDFDDSYFVCHTTYRILQRSSSNTEPSHPLCRVFAKNLKNFHFFLFFLLYIYIDFVIFSNFLLKKKKF